MVNEIIAKLHPETISLIYGGGDNDFEKMCVDDAENGWIYDLIEAAADALEL